MPRKYTPPELALKSYDGNVKLQPIMPIVDYDNEDIIIDNPDFDKDDCHWLNDMDWVESYINPSVDEHNKYRYELTITFDRKIHTYISMLDLEKHLNIIKYYIEETLYKQIDDWFVVKEYHKQSIGVLKKKPPHYHMMITTSEEIEPCELWNLNKAFNRHFGMNTFKPVEDKRKYAQYMCKEVIDNIKKYNQPHLFIVY